eukprot:5605734-Amphidinium_carterae.1
MANATQWKIAGEELLFAIGGTHATKCKTMCESVSWISSTDVYHWSSLGVGAPVVKPSKVPSMQHVHGWQYSHRVVPSQQSVTLKAVDPETSKPWLVQQFFTTHKIPRDCATSVKTEHRAKWLSNVAASSGVSVCPEWFAQSKTHCRPPHCIRACKAPPGFCTLATRMLLRR